MKETAWKAFCTFKAEYKEECLKNLNALGYKYSPPASKDPAVHSFSAQKAALCKNGIALLQEKAACANGTPKYPVETPVVYNHALDDVKKTDEIKLIVIGDNPGKNEQLHKNQRYLVGLAGKIADNFFKAHPGFGIDFRKNVIILNKTPIHTAKTKELSRLLKEDTDGSFKQFFEKTQIFNAKKTAQLQKALQCPLWLIGYGELREKGLFKSYAKTLKNEYEREKEPPVFLYQHFSMNCFAINLKKNYDNTVSIEENVVRLGIRHRKDILGF